MPRIVESLSPGCFPFCASRSRPCSRKSLYNPCKSRPVSFLSGISPIRGVICFLLILEKRYHNSAGARMGSD
ncbi:MAG: hypothetical protein UD575_01405, partial [Oscillospiraceae bacterium]|nr:hypothetical protein [Oscillospiraceae bacterium]